MKSSKTIEKKKLYTGFLIFFLICLLFQIFPFAEIANKPLPIVFGMPFLMFWIVMWIIIEFVGLIILYYIDVIKYGGDIK